MSAVHPVLPAVRELAGTVLSVGGALLVSAAVVILVIGFVRAWRDGRRTKLVVATLEDATCDPATDGAAVGITHRLREEILETLPHLAGRWKDIVEHPPPGATSPIGTMSTHGNALAVQLVDDIATTQRQLTESIESLAPDSARNALHVVAQTLLHPRGIQVSGALQRTSDAPGGVGMSFTVNELHSRDAARHITIWEDGTSQVAGKALLERIHALVVPASRALACELLRQQLTNTRSERRFPLGLALLIGSRRAVRRAYRREAVVDFVTGLVYQETAHTCLPATVSFYRLSASALERADAGLDYYKAPFLRALSLAELGKREEDDERAASVLTEANRLLDDAHRQLPAAGLPDEVMRVEDLKIREAVATNCCVIVERLPDEADRAKQAAAVIAELQSVDPSLHEDSSLLYNLACTLAVASRMTELKHHGLVADRCLTHAQRSLLHACLRDDGWWHDATVDVDLASLHPWMPRARRLLADARAARTATAVLNPAARSDVVEEVLVQAARSSA